MSEDFVSHQQKPYHLVKIVGPKWAEKLQDGEVFMRAIAALVTFQDEVRMQTISSGLTHSMVLPCHSKIIIIRMHTQRILLDKSLR